jgi:hypothetical protein
MVPSFCDHRSREETLTDYVECNKTTTVGSPGRGWRDRLGED